MARTRTPSAWPLLIAGLAALAACAPKGSVRRPGASSDAASAGGAEPGATPAVETAEANIRGTEFTQVQELRPVRFAYDAYALDDEARGVLQQNARYLKGQPDLEVLVAGHCDQRGTIEYNLALGQKRAKAVRDYYLRVGVSGKAVATISYGKEQLLCSDSTEDCWATNRRAETRVRSRTASAQTGSRAR